MTSYRQAEFKPVASSNDGKSLESYVEDYKRAGYETELRRDADKRTRLYVRHSGRKHAQL